MSKFVFFWYYPEILYNYSILLSGKFLVLDNVSTIRNLNDEMFNDVESINIMNDERNKKSIKLLNAIRPGLDKDFILGQLEIIKNVQMKAMVKSQNKTKLYTKLKSQIKNTLFNYVNKNIYYDKIDYNSVKFYKNVLTFYSENNLSNDEIVLSRNHYKNWM
jgi:hypothetical protein